jgi:hypothetical protein
MERKIAVDDAISFVAQLGINALPTVGIQKF